MYDIEFKQMQMIKLHFVHEEKGLLFKKLLAYVPRPGDEIRVGGPSNEEFYVCTRVVWALDEDGPYERANVGIIDEARKDG